MKSLMSWWISGIVRARVFVSASSDAPTRSPTLSMERMPAWWSCSDEIEPARLRAAANFVRPVKC